MWVYEALKRMFFAGRRFPCAARKLFLLPSGKGQDEDEP